MCMYVCHRQLFVFYQRAHIFAWPLLFTSPSSSLSLCEPHQHFVINMCRQCEEDKNRQKRQTVCLDSKPLFCIVTSGAYMNTEAFSSLKANKNTGRVIDWIHSLKHQAMYAIPCAVLRKASYSYKDCVEDLD